MIRAIITDFDGTLVDTFDANLCAYQSVLANHGVSLTEEKYRECFGLRFEEFMSVIDIHDEIMQNLVRISKQELYPKYFKYLTPNSSLIELIDTFHKLGGKTAIASTARKENLMNILNYLGITSLFDVIYAGEDVIHGKPSPEIYLKTMETLGVHPDETLIFEDSEVGIAAANSSGAHVFVISPNQF
jgi:HAD superfamily hydrolase (TIGR01509 family)